MTHTVEDPYKPDAVLFAIPYVASVLARIAEYDATHSHEAAQRLRMQGNAIEAARLMRPRPWQSLPIMDMARRKRAWDCDVCGASIGSEDRAYYRHGSRDRYAHVHCGVRADQKTTGHKDTA